MARVLRTSKAEEDLVGIWSYIAADSLLAADKLLDDIDAACKMLSTNPLAGRLREELAPQLRSFGVSVYIVFYRPTDAGVIVIRVLHGARDLPASL